jgi:hypothetical protein
MVKEIVDKVMEETSDTAVIVASHGLARSD